MYGLRKCSCSTGHCNASVRIRVTTGVPAACVCPPCLHCLRPKRRRRHSCNADDVRIVYYSLARCIASRRSTSAPIAMGAQRGTEGDGFLVRTHRASYALSVRAARRPVTLWELQLSGASRGAAGGECGRRCRHRAGTPRTQAHTRRQAHTHTHTAGPNPFPLCFGRGARNPRHAQRTTHTPIATHAGDVYRAFLSVRSLLPSTGLRLHRAPRLGTLLRHGTASERD